MANPTKFTPGFDYSAHEAVSPTKPKPGAKLDDDFENVALSIGQTVDAVKDVRRSDGALQNGIVTADSLAAELVNGFPVLRGAWAVDTIYKVGDGVVYLNKVYRSNANHAATEVNRPDLDPVTWAFLFDLDVTIPLGVFAAADRTALKAIDPATTKAVYLGESGRQGVFDWAVGNFSSQVAADTKEAIYIKADAVAATAGAWVRSGVRRTLYAGWTGGDLQAAIDLAFTLGLTTVEPQALHVLTAALRMRPGVSLRCAPGAATIQQAAGANLASVIEWSTNSATGAGLDGVKVDGNRAANTVTVLIETFLLYIVGADNVKIRNCDIGNFTGHAVYSSGTHSLVIEHNTIHDFSMYGVYVAATVASSRDAPRVVDNFLFNVGMHAIMCARCDMPRIENNRVQALGVHGQVVTVAGTSVTWVSGPDFSLVKPGHFIIYNGGFEALVTDVLSSTQLTINIAAGNATNTPAATGAGDLITVVGCSSARIVGNTTLGGASLGVSLVGSPTYGNDAGALVQGNIVATIGSAGYSIQTIGANTVVDACFIGNKAVESGLNGSAADANFNAGMTVSGTALNIIVTDNTWLSYGSAMRGLNVLTSGANVKTANNISSTSDKTIQNGCTVTLGSQWNGASVSALEVYDDTIVFLVTTTATPPAANAGITLTHRVVPLRRKAPVCLNTATNNAPIRFVTFYPDSDTTSVFVSVDTPSASSTYRIVVRL